MYSQQLVAPIWHWGLVVAVGGCLWLLALTGGGPSSSVVSPHLLAQLVLLLLFPCSPPLSWLAASPHSVGTHLVWAGVFPISAGGPPIITFPSYLCRNNIKLVKYNNKRTREKTYIWATVVNIPIYSLFLVYLTFLIYFQRPLFRLCYLETTDIFLHFSIEYASYLMRRTLGTCSDTLGNFFLRQVTSKALCST